MSQEDAQDLNDYSSDIDEMKEKAVRQKLEQISLEAKEQEAFESAAGGSTEPEGAAGGYSEPVGAAGGSSEPGRATGGSRELDGAAGRSSEPEGAAGGSSKPEGDPGTSQESDGVAAAEQHTRRTIRIPPELLDELVNGVFNFYLELLESADQLVISSIVICRHVAKILQTHYPGYGIDPEAVLLMQIDAEAIIEILFENYDPLVGIAEAARSIGIQEHISLAENNKNDLEKSDQDEK